MSAIIMRLKMSLFKKHIISNLKKTIFISLGLYLPFSYSYAQQLIFDISINNKNLSGYYSDGTVIGYGMISHLDEHKGFLISTNQRKSSITENNIIITGKTNINNTINIKIAGNNWRTDEDNNFILITKEKEAYFQLILNGEQYIKPDKYNISLNGAYIIK